MPTSRPITLNYICDTILQLQPKSVLDIGVGFGKNGFLAREYTDIWSGRLFGNWTTRIDGIEVFDKYLTQIQYAIYDSIYVGDASKVLPTLGNYDLILCTAVLEHFTLEDGKALLEQIKLKRNILGIVVLPEKVKPQGPVYGNENERHISNWSPSDLNPYGRLRVVKGGINNQYLLEI